jgi:hypothetical protein
MERVLELQSFLYVPAHRFARLIQLDKEPAIKVREPNANNQLMSQRRILGFKSQPRPEWRGQDA